MSTHVRLDDALRTSGLLTPAELERAEALARSRDIALPRAAVALGLLAEDQFLEPAADGAQLEVSTPTEEDADPEVVALLPFDELLKQCALPLRREGDDTLVVAFAAPPGAGLLTRLARLSGLTIRPTLASAPRVRRILGRIAGDGGESPSRAATQDPSGVTAFFRHLTSGL